jgi:hypothetical protein
MWKSASFGLWLSPQLNNIGFKKILINLIAILNYHNTKMPVSLERKYGLMGIRNFLLTVLSFIPYFLIAQDYSYANYDSKDGLAGSTVYCADQDKDGFIWFGTETGRRVKVILFSGSFFF